jgi:hypothetical protein
MNTPTTNEAIKLVFEQIKEVKNNLEFIQKEINQLKYMNNTLAVNIQNNERIHEVNYRRVQDMAMMMGIEQQEHQQSNDDSEDEMPAKRRKLTHYTERETPTPRPILPRPTLLPAPANTSDMTYAMAITNNDPPMPVAPPSTPANSPTVPVFTGCFEDSKQCFEDSKQYFEEHVSNHYYDIDGVYDF